jgi:hypothetical protein
LHPLHRLHGIFDRLQEAVPVKKSVVDGEASKRWLELELKERFSWNSFIDATAFLPVSTRRRRC